MCAATTVVIVAALGSAGADGQVIDLLPTGGTFSWDSLTEGGLVAVGTLNPDGMCVFFPPLTTEIHGGQSTLLEARSLQLRVSDECVVSVKEKDLSIQGSDSLGDGVTPRLLPENTVHQETWTQDYYSILVRATEVESHMSWHFDAANDYVSHSGSIVGCWANTNHYHQVDDCRESTGYGSYFMSYARHEGEGDYHFDNGQFTAWYHTIHHEQRGWADGTYSCYRHVHGTPPSSDLGDVCEEL